VYVLQARLLLRYVYNRRQPTPDLGWTVA